MNGKLAGDTIAQSFQAKQPFNHVSLAIVPYVTNQAKPLQYELALWNVQKDIIASQVFDIHQLAEGKLNMEFPTVYPEGEGIYYLSCRPVFADLNNYISVSTFEETIFDLNESGTLYVDGAECRRDAKFSAYEVLSAPYESIMEYVLSFGLVLVLEFCIFLDFRRLFVPEQKKRGILSAGADSKWEKWRS